MQSVRSRDEFKPVTRLLEYLPHGDLRLVDGRDITIYAILSHTWSKNNDDEVICQDLISGNADSGDKDRYKEKEGYKKIRFCGEQALKHGIKFFWVDTCCIDKTNSTELSESIISMFRWYSQATKCYVYLGDVSTTKRDHNGENGLIWLSSFRRATWFTRGWTLQELLAPLSVEFFSRNGVYLGDKESLETTLQEVTRIPLGALRAFSVSDFPPEEKFTWAENRVTRKEEDIAYCLQGLFGVHVTPKYGEGQNAAKIRLKNKIAKFFRHQLDQREEQAGASPGGTKSTNRQSEALAIKEKLIQQRRHVLLDSLDFASRDSRQSTVKMAFNTTCDWVLSHSAFLSWTDLEQPPHKNGRLWIIGKPGVGKSTLMKYIHAHVNEQAQDNEIVISFFFNARGDGLGKTVAGMYRALLIELFQKAPDLKKVLDLTPGNEGDIPEWTDDLLGILFSAALSKLNGRILKCFVDALDECEEAQVREMVEKFIEFQQRVFDGQHKFYICFASRHYPAIEFHSAQKLILENENDHDEDLRRYVQNHLQAGDGKYIREVRQQILDKANGVFLWVVLVVPILNVVFSRGRIFAVKHKLREIPSQLSDLFKGILRRDSEDLTDLLHSLQWILFAERPLRCEEYYFIMLCAKGTDYDYLAAWDPEQVSREAMIRFVNSSSNGLAEVTRSGIPLVQFIHESVRDFLIKENGLQELWPELGPDPNALCHDELKRQCYEYLSVDLPFKRGRSAIDSSFPFLEYAVSKVLYHANIAAEQVAQGDFLDKFHIRRWVEISNVFHEYESEQYSHQAELLYILAHQGHAMLIRSGRMKVTWHATEEYFRYSICAALKLGHREAVQALLGCEGATGMEVIDSAMYHFDDFLMRNHSTPFRWALEHDQEAFAELIAAAMTKEDVDFDLRSGDWPIELALTRAALDDNKHFVQMLLDKGASSFARHVNSSTLHMCAAKGYTKTAQMMLDRGTDPNARSEHGESALQVASAKGHVQIVQALLDSGADSNLRTEHSESALQAASARGNSQIVQMLLNQGADVDAKEGRGPPLYIAAGLGHTQVLRTLLKHGVRINTTEGDYGTALYVASSHGHAQVVQTLLEWGADVHLRGGYLCICTALQVASEKGHTHIMEMLKAKGAK